MTETITALMVSPGKHPVITQLCDDSEYLNLAVSIDDPFLTHDAEVRAVDEDVVALCARQNSALDLDSNRRIGKRILSGTFYVVGIKDGNLRSLCAAEITKYTSRFWEPELFTEDEVIDFWFDGLFLAF